MKHLIFTILKIKTIILCCCLMVSLTNLNAAWVDATFSWTGINGYRAQGTFTYDDTYSNVSYEEGWGTGLQSLSVSFYDPSNVLLGTFNNVVDEEVTYRYFYFNFNTTTLTLSDYFDVGEDHGDEGDYYLYAEIGAEGYLFDVYSNHSLSFSNPTSIPVIVSVSAPTTQASGVTFSLVTQTSFTISCTKGNGAKRAMFVKEGSGTITNPSDNTTYSASSDWSVKGSQLGSSGYYCVYNGTGTTVALTNLSPSTTYYVQVFDYNGDAGSEAYNTNTSTNNPNNETTENGSLTWDGSEGTAWNTAANWDGNVVPTESYTVTIPGSLSNYPMVASGVGASCNDLIIESGGSLTINSGGSLITNGTLTNNGTMQISRTLTESQWHMVSVPVEGITANTFLGDYLQTWDEANGMWVNISDPLTALNTKQGYSLWATPGKSDHTYTFTGTLLTGNQSTPITYHAVSGNDFDGANLLGNPYPSSIDWDQLQATYGSNYIWDGTAYKAYSSQIGYDLGYRYIPPLQAFFIIAGSSGNFDLTNAARTHSGAANFYKSGGEKTFENGIVLAASNGTYTDEWCLVFNPEASEDFELPLDAWKLRSSTPGLSQLWSVTTEGNLSIDIRPQAQTIQLGFANDQAGIYTIGISQIADVSSAMLEDTKTNTLHNLQTKPCEFAWDPVMDDEKRFKLHLNAVGIEESQTSESNLQIYAANGQIFVKNGNDLETDGRTSIQYVTVSDVMGRVVLQKEISGNGIISVPANLQTGVYLVTVQSGKEIKTVKVFIKK